MHRAYKLRELQPALQNKAYFNYGGQGPLPAPSLEAMMTSWKEIQKLGPFTNNVWPYICKEINQTKNMLANICGVKSSRIALTENVSSGCLLALWGIPFQEGDEILISDCEHPGIIAACTELAKRKKLILSVLAVKHIKNQDNKGIVKVLKSLESSLSSKTVLVVISHILWNTGLLVPIFEISKILSSHPRKPFLMVDAAQSFGQIPLDKEASSSDIYAFTGHKWACGPEGLGGVCISERIIEEASPTMIGWKSIVNEKFVLNQTEGQFFQDARKFEQATSCIPLLAGLRSSLNLLDNVGSIDERIKLIQRLTQIVWGKINHLNMFETILEDIPATGLVSFKYKGDKNTKMLVNILGRKSIWIRDLDDPICLRACVNITTTSMEIEALIESLKLISI